MRAGWPILLLQATRSLSGAPSISITGSPAAAAAEASVKARVVVPPLFTEPTEMTGRFASRPRRRRRDAKLRVVDDGRAIHSIPELEPGLFRNF
ncbi:hypothetical protein GCM10011390_00450 [Aureimonas endophytica]|uniref:Uncharacterized protein n=1 Tax=Aureimonas endophytica TaxID=2027858 RepID=A0A916ZBJ9_9HYPH|nr:hypothetical protein GCM10011390_00450 [Aureimonas endophytica]